MRAKLVVKEIAEKQGYNMSSLSRKSDVSFRTIKRYFQKPFTPAHTDVLQKVAEALGVKIGELIVEEE